jgi:copper(I)-binding protein
VEDVWNVYGGVKRAMLKSNPIESKDQNLVFQLFFLINNKNQDIEVVEISEIDFTEVKRRLEKGDSVFITRKRKQELEPILVAGEETADPWYFYHI